MGEVDEDGKYLLYNHVRIIISVNADPYAEEDGDVPKWRVVGFEVVPTSIKHRYENEPMAGQELDSDTCGKFVNIEEVSQGNYQYLNPEGETTVLYTYDVQFVKSDIVWEERWDRIISSKSSNDQIHWFSIINSLMIVLFLTGMIAMIMLRTLHRDIARYNEVQTTEEAQEESGWKLVHGDVFRPPQLSPMLFSVVVGTGVQVCCMSASTMVIALLGLLSPANRGSLLTTLLLLFVFMGSFAGYHSSRTYKMFNGKDWKKNTILTAVLYPGLLFAVFFLLNLVLWGKSSSQAVPFGTLLRFWCCGSVFRCHSCSSAATLDSRPLQLSSLCARTRLPVRSRSKCGTFPRLSASWWAAFCLSAPCSLSCSSLCRRCGCTRSTTCSASCSSCC